MNDSYQQKPEEVVRKWYLIDATDKTLGRLATQVADLLRGKGKPTFTPNVDCGDYVIIINAEKVHVTGDKMNGKMYYTHSGHPGGFKVTTLATLLTKTPEKVIERAVKGMIPHNHLGAAVYKKLFVYAGPDYEQKAQKPEVFEIK